MGTGVASGEERAALAAQQAISSPLLEDVNISGAQGVLVNITGGDDLTLHEVDEATSIIFEEAGPDANIIFGAVIDPSLTDSEIRVTVIATGFSRAAKVGETARPFDTEKTPLSQIEAHAVHNQFNMPTFELKKETVKKTGAETKNDALFFGDDLEIPAFIRQRHQ